MPGRVFFSPFLMPLDRTNPQSETKTTRLRAMTKTYHGLVYLAILLPHTAFLFRQRRGFSSIKMLKIESGALLEGLW